MAKIRKSPVKYRDMLHELEQDHDFNRWWKIVSKIKPPRSKVPIYLDRNLPAEVIEEFQSLSRVFRIVGVSKENQDDDSVFHYAHANRALLITLDEDFWNDRKFPLHRTPGIVIVKGRTADEIGHAIALFLVAFAIVEGVRRDPRYAFRQKFRISLTGYVSKLLTHESKVEEEEIFY